MILSYYGAKGGQGTTTTAVANAILLSHKGPTLFVDRSGDNDATAVYGAAPIEYGEFVPMGDNLTMIALHGPVEDHIGMFDHVVIDYGREFPDYGTPILVTHACYLALRAALKMPHPERVVLIEEPFRSLGVEDVRNVLDVDDVTIIESDPAVARAVDAGLFGTRLPRAFNVLR
jgi:hypothetical protein